MASTIYSEDILTTAGRLLGWVSSAKARCDTWLHEGFASKSAMRGGYPDLDRRAGTKTSRHHGIALALHVPVPRTVPRLRFVATAACWRVFTLIHK